MKQIIVPLLFLFLAACNQFDLHHHLEEEDADEIMVLLHHNGVDARKEKEMEGQEVHWKVTVPRGALPAARALLVQNNLPRRRELGLSGVYKEKGLIPTPDEQRARFLLALKGEIINSLQKLPGVVDSDVVLNVPTEDQFSLMEGELKRPTASVILRLQPGADANAVTEDKVQRFVANAVPKLDPNDVAVIMTRAGTGGTIVEGGQSVQTTPAAATVASGPREELWMIAGLKMDAASRNRFRLYTLIGLGALMLLSIALIVNVVRLNRLRQKMPEPIETTALPQATGGGFLTDGVAVARGTPAGSVRPEGPDRQSGARGRNLGEGKGR